MGKTPSHPGSILLFLLIFSSSVARSASNQALVEKPQSIENEIESWSKSGFSMKDLSQVIPYENCLNSLRDLEACVQAINKGLSFIDPTLILIPSSRIETLPQFDSLDKQTLPASDLGEFSLVRTKQLALSDAEKTAFRQKEKKLRQASLQKLIETKAKITARFNEIFNRLGEILAQQKEQLSFRLGKIGNTYLSNRFDPHTRLEVAQSTSASIFQNENNVTWSLERESLTGYIKILDFMGVNTVELVRTAILELQKTGAQGFVLDLRDNTGGDVRKATEVADLFLEARVSTRSALTKLITQTKPTGINLSLLPEEFQESVRTKNQEQLTFNYYSYNRKVTDLPLVILQNASTASASELLVGTLKYYNRAFIVGTNSFGKGIVQAVTQQLGDKTSTGGSVFRIDTITRYFLPDGEHSPQVYGNEPDRFSYRTIEGSEEEKNAVYEKDLANHVAPIGEKYEDSASRKRAIVTVNECIDQRSSLGGTHPDDLQLQTSYNALACLTNSTAAIASN